MSFNAYKQRAARSMVLRPIHHELDRVPRQFSDYMNEHDKCNRFSEICRMYLEGMTLDDIQYMKPDDLINLVPHEHYRHKLLMTILVRRYLYRPDECETVCCRPDRGDIFIDTDSIDSCTSVDRDRTDCNHNHSHEHKCEYKCSTCNHVCNNSNCGHKCSDYSRLSVQI